jgi:signal transduction histidine kinase
MKHKTNSPTAFQNRIKNIYRSLYFTPFVIFLTLIMMTYVAWQTSHATLNNDIQAAIGSRTRNTEDIIKQRLNEYQQIIIGGAGLIRSSNDVTLNEWTNYVGTFKIDKNFAGAQAIGYIRIFSASEIPALTAYMQQQGVTGFTVAPDTPREQYTAILYAEPPQLVSPVGLDYSTEPVRSLAMARARDTGSSSISEPVESLVKVTNQPLIFMFFPQYQANMPIETPAQRQAAIKGYVYAAIRTEDFVGNIVNEAESRNDMVVRVTSVLQGESSKLVYESPNYKRLVSDKKYVQSEQTIGMYGKTWKINYGFRLDSLARPQRQNMPTWIAIAGFLFSVLLAEVILLLLKARARDLSKQKEQAVDLAKDELLSLASHQLRTPATTVKQYLGMVLQGFAGDITKTQKNLLEKAYAGNERQLYIINEMLHIAKIDSGRIVLAKQKTDIVRLVEEVLAEAKADIGQANHKLTLKLPKQPVYIKADAHMLRMAIENIVSNAIKYTLPGGKIAVTVAKDKSVLRITVKDSGVGIEQKDFQKLYKLFTRLDNKRIQNVSGTGVGLYLAKHLIRLHKGRLSLTSAPGKGSAFMITLPLSSSSRD